MTIEGEKQISERQAAQIETPDDTKVRVSINVDTVRALVHNLASANCNGLEITPDMSRAQIEESLRLYNYPLSILYPEGSSLVYDAVLLQQCNDAWQNAQEEDMREHVVMMHQNQEMVFVEESGKLVGMLGKRKLGEINGRQLYELPRFSIVGDDEKCETRILHKLMRQMQEAISKECQNPLILVHTKRPSVRKWAMRREHSPITIDDYARLRSWPRPPDEALRKRWEKEGWEYFVVDPLQLKKSSRNTDDRKSSN